MKVGAGRKEGAQCLACWRVGGGGWVSFWFSWFGGLVEERRVDVRVDLHQGKRVGKRIGTESYLFGKTCGMPFFCGMMGHSRVLGSSIRCFIFFWGPLWKGSCR